MRLAWKPVLEQERCFQHATFWLQHVGWLVAAEAPSSVRANRRLHRQKSACCLPTLLRHSFAYKRFAPLSTESTAQVQVVHPITQGMHQKLALLRTDKTIVKVVICTPMCVRIHLHRLFKMRFATSSSRKQPIEKSCSYGALSGSCGQTFLSDFASTESFCLLSDIHAVGTVSFVNIFLDKQTRRLKRPLRLHSEV